MAEKRALFSAQQAYDYVEDRGGIPDKKIKNLYLSEFYKDQILYNKVLTPEVPYEQARQRHHLGDLSKAPPSLLSNKTFSENLDR